MLKVLIADDHYPVLEFLLQSIPWEELNLNVIAQCSDGLEALRACEQDTPHILITDIGMPRMNGMELIEVLKADHPALQVIILSCHDEFHYAQKAVRLGVNDYVLKESLEPEALTALLRKISEDIIEQFTDHEKNCRLQRIVHQSNSLLKTEFIRTTLSNPIINADQWRAELLELGVDTSKQPYMPVLIYPNAFHTLKHRFHTEDLFMYACENVVNELIDSGRIGVSFRYSAKEIFILFPFVKSLKQNQHEIIRGHLVELRKAFNRYMGISISMMTAEPVQAPGDLKNNLQTLLGSRDQRFYAAEGSLFKWVPFQTTGEDIFTFYRSALDDFKRLIAQEQEDQTEMVVNEWMQYIHDRRFPVDAVVSWVLKLVMDIEIKYNSLQHFTTQYSAEILHKKIVDLESLHEMKKYLIAFIRDKIHLASTIKQQSQRTEIYEAKKYVISHLHEKISMEEVATRLMLNPSHFSRIFKNETGETFIEYVTRVKMERAKEVLELSDMTVEHIAESLGYDNTSYFIKLFKAFSGYSPKDYRVMR